MERNHSLLPWKHAFLMQSVSDVSFIRRTTCLESNTARACGCTYNNSEEAFDISLGQLYQRWERLAPGFHTWFQSQQVDVFRHSMIQPVQ